MICMISINENGPKVDELARIPRSLFPEKLSWDIIGEITEGGEKVTDLNGRILLFCLIPFSPTHS